VGLTGGTPNNLAYRDGEKSHHITADNLVDELERMVRAKVQKQRDDEAKGIIASSE